ncbi:hypothetical protein [Actinoplanes rectilineatus]|uniref:hypothetical protein n=1 Tax=Actinoplanes rectilineatus TaxID=113571 RepID=UPI0005F2BDF2|nr:hypothetical protein [Actinoplanes rectilineatus]
MYDFTAALRLYYAVLTTHGISAEAIGKRLTYHRQTITATLNGQRKVPNLAIAKGLHDMAAEHVGAEELPRFPSVDELERLHELIRKGTCETCKRPWTEPDTTPGAGEPPSAALTVAAPAAQDDELPVPPAVVDRQLVWDGMHDLQRHLRRNRLPAAAGITLHTGRYAPPADAASAIIVSSDEGLSDVSSDLILYAARRPDAEILSVAHVLLKNGGKTAAEELIAYRLERQ